MEDRKTEDVAFTEDETGVFQVEIDQETSQAMPEEMPEETPEKAKVKTNSGKNGGTGHDDQDKKWEERYLYLRADFDNYKKRVQKDQLDQFKFANEKLLREVLSVLDNLDRAILHFNESRDFEKVSEGLTLVSKQFVSFLNRFGVTPIESLNQPFDPECHQAVGHIGRADIPEGNVAEEVQKGYRLYDRLIRPAFVMISQKETQKETAVPFVSEADENNPPLGGTIDSSV
jgi:molecular chaperone GrpE